MKLGVKMKRYILIIFFLFCFLCKGFAQSIKFENEELKLTIYYNFVNDSIEIFGKCENKCQNDLIINSYLKVSGFNFINDSSIIITAGVYQVNSSPTCFYNKYLVILKAGSVFDYGRYKWKIDNIQNKTKFRVYMDFINVDNLEKKIWKKIKVIKKPDFDFVSMLSDDYLSNSEYIDFIFPRNIESK